MPTYITAVTYDGETYCREHLPRGISAASDDVDPAYADPTIDYYPVCGICGREHTVTERPTLAIA